jgi:hypothetical protein
MTDEPTTPPPPPPETPRPAGLPGPSKSLFERAKDIIVQPRTEWGVIDAEPSTIASIYTGYVLILAAIGPIAMVIGHQVFGIGGFGFTFKPSIGFSIASAVMTYAVSLISIYVLALIIDALAPSFGGTKNQLNAFKVAAYSWTAAWLAGIFQIIPALAILGIVGLYSLYLLYLGLPRLMRAPEDKAVGYTVVVILAAIVLWVVAMFIVGALVVAFVGTGMPSAVIRY